MGAVILASLPLAAKINYDKIINVRWLLFKQTAKWNYILNKQIKRNATIWLKMQIFVCSLTSAHTGIKMQSINGDCD